MKRKEIKKLVNSSYVNGELDKNMVLKATKELTRKDLKEYIKTLKIFEQKKRVFVYSASSIKDSLFQKELENKFQGKKFIYKIDKNIIAGVKIQDYDNVYDFTLKSKLERMINITN